MKQQTVASNHKPRPPNNPINPISIVMTFSNLWPSLPFSLSKTRMAPVLHSPCGCGVLVLDPTDRVNELMHCNGENSPLNHMLYCWKCLDLWVEQEYECNLPRERLEQR